MTMHAPRFGAGASAAEVTDALKTDGCAIVERLVAPEVMQRARRELQPFLDATPPGRDDFSGLRTRRTGGLLGRSATCRELIQHPLVLDSVRGVLSPAKRYWKARSVAPPVTREPRLNERWMLISVTPPSISSDTRVALTLASCHCPASTPASSRLV